MTTEANHEQWETALRDAREIVESYLWCRDAMRVRPLTTSEFLDIVNGHAFALYKSLPSLTDEQYRVLWLKVNTNEWVVFDKSEMQGALEELLHNLVELLSNFAERS